ncbi:isochorismatase hydrolase [Dehalogenimonas lykanthroporepellens BL-DC-9]|nr:isochorismatase hydrolase [Dehalogenimonas lykanthroporepellens BL-DC-9]
MLEPQNTLLLIIDVQEKLFRVMDEKSALLKNIVALARGSALLEIPAIITEQNPDGLGPTLKEITDARPEALVSTKFSFDCCGETGFTEMLSRTGRRQIIVCGIESHICVYQTAMGLREAGYAVQVVADAVASRSPANRELALRRLEKEGIALTGTEMALFELLRTARADLFKAVSALIK